MLDVRYLQGFKIHIVIYRERRGEHAVDLFTGLDKVRVRGRRLSHPRLRMKTSRFLALNLAASSARPRKQAVKTLPV